MSRQETFRFRRKSDHLKKKKSILRLVSCLALRENTIGAFVQAKRRIALLMQIKAPRLAARVTALFPRTHPHRLVAGKNIVHADRSGRLHCRTPQKEVNGVSWAYISTHRRNALSLLSYDVSCHDSIICAEPTRLPWPPRDGRDLG